MSNATSRSSSMGASVLGVPAAVLWFIWMLTTPITPKPIKIQLPTEQSIRKEMKHEQLEKQYLRAAATARAIYHRNGCRSTFAIETGRAAIDYGVPPRILAALVFVESSCNSSATSRDGSIGLTQPNTRVWKFTKAQLLNPEFNLRAGASILASNVRRYGLKQGLHAYNGFGNKTDDYSTKVLTAAGIHVS